MEVTLGDNWEPFKRTKRCRSQANTLWSRSVLAPHGANLLLCPTGCEDADSMKGQHPTILGSDVRPLPLSEAVNHKHASVIRH